MKQAEFQRLQQAIGRYAQELAAAAQSESEFEDWLTAAILQTGAGEWPPKPDSAPLHDRLIPRLAECLAKLRAGIGEGPFDEAVAEMAEGAGELWAAVHEGDLFGDEG